MIDPETYINNVYEEALDLIKQLASIPSPSLEEDWRCSFILNWLKENKIDNAYIDEAKNVIIPYHEGEEKLDLFLAHTDIVFPDIMPIKVKEEGDKLLAPGVGDDTANVVALLLFARYVISNNLPTKRGVLFIANSAEEGMGNLLGSKQICTSFKEKINTFTSFDLNLGSVVCEAVGSERYSIKVNTIGGHSYSAFGNPNAIVELSKVIVKLSEQKVSKLGKTTFNFGTIKGGTSINSIAQEATCTYEYRSNKLLAIMEMREYFYHQLDKFKEAGLDISVEVIGSRPCGNEVDCSLLTELASDCLTKQGIKPVLTKGSTDCNIPLSYGIQSICMGLVTDIFPHTREEYILKSSIKPGYIAGLKYLLKVITL